MQYSDNVEFTEHTKFCFCCGQTKIYSEYHLNKGIPEKYCKNCLKKFTAKERKNNEYKIIFGVITDKIKGEIWEKKF